jgi:hypothetical protein
MDNIKLFEEFDYGDNKPVQVVIGLLIKSSKNRFFLVHRGDGMKYWSLILTDFTPSLRFEILQ